MTQYLRKLRGGRSVVAAMLLATLLIVSGCAGGGSTSSNATPAPTFSPAAGSYPSAQNVTVSDTNQGAVLYCTNDGSTPTASSPHCANPITVSQSQTINAIAIASGMSASSVATAAYTIAGSAAVPTVTGIGPATGPTSGGTAVTIIGTNFTGATAVNFGTLPATSFVVNSAGSITATSPAQGTGSVNITVVTSGGTSATSNADLYTYATSPTPVISSVTPGSGPAGSTVAIVGTNFGATQGSSKVTFNGVVATSFTSWTSTSILATVPSGATTGNVVVTVGGVASAGVAFTVTLPAPTISQIAPDSGVAGDTVTIIGANFGTAAGSVTFGGVPASIGTWSTGAIVATVPSGLSAGSVPVTVTTAAAAGGQSATSTFTVNSSVPTISNINPTSGSAGISVTISGSGFGSTAGTVSFGGTPATVAGGNWSDGSIKTTVPAGLSAGSINVQVTTASGQTTSVPFTVTISSVTINSINPASGAAGTSVTISGSGFGSTAGTVSFGGTAATVAGGNWSDTQITTTVPSGVSTGSLTVTVATAASPSETGSASFTVLASISGVVLSGPASGGTPITSAMVQLYAAGTSGYGAGATPIGNPVTSDATSGAFFGIIYDCSTLTAPGDQLYLTATGNSGVVLMAALGSCANIGTSFANGVTINEATTIASAYALSGFASINSGGGITIGAPAGGTSCNAAAGWKSTGPSTCNYIGLSNAFATVNNLVNVATGTALAVTPAYTANNVAYENASIAPQARVNSLANALATCSNPTNGNCTGLFTNATLNSVVPADTLQAAFNIARSPGNNANNMASNPSNSLNSIAAVAAASSAFAPALSSADLANISDWSLAIIYQAGGLGNPGGYYPLATAIAIDGNGNVWVPTNYNAAQLTATSVSITDAGGSVAVFNNLGAPLSPSYTPASGNVPVSLGGFTTGSIHNPQSIAIDQNGNAWIGNAPTATGSFAAGSVSVINAAGTAQYGTDTTPFTNPVLLTPNPYGIAIDANSNVWISSNTGFQLPSDTLPCGAAYGGGILQMQISGGVIAAGTATDTFSDNSSCPSFLAIDQNGNLWTYDAGDYNGDDFISGGSLSLFGTGTGSAAAGALTGGPFYNSAPLYAPAAFDSAGFGWSSGDLGFLGGSATPGLGDSGMIKMPNIGGVTDSNALNPGFLSQYDPTVYSPAGSVAFNRTADTAVAIDGAGQAWVTGTFTDAGTASESGLFVVNNADTSPLSPTVGYLGYAPLSVDTVHSDNTAAAVDGSGNVWAVGRAVPKSGSSVTTAGSQLMEFIGIGVPVSTPLANGVAANSIAQRP